MKSCLFVFEGFGLRIIIRPSKLCCDFLTSVKVEIFLNFYLFPYWYVLSMWFVAFSSCFKQVEFDCFYSVWVMNLSILLVKDCFKDSIDFSYQVRSVKARSFFLLYSRAFPFFPWVISSYLFWLSRSVCPLLCSLLLI